MTIEFPTDNYGTNEDWVLLSKILGKRIIIRADVIQKPTRAVDFDGHECSQTSAKSSVKCKTKDILINDSIFKKR
jgi:hypothetical protein